MDARRHPEGMNPAEQSGAQERIAQAKAGNAEAWGDLYREYAPAIFRFCRRAMPTREDAEDATMDIFIKVPQKLSQYDASRPFGAWLYTVAANHLLGPGAAAQETPGRTWKRAKSKICRSSIPIPARSNN